MAAPLSERVYRALMVAGNDLLANEYAASLTESEHDRALKEAAWQEGLQDFLSYLNGRGKYRPPYPKNPYRKDG